jgi:hypothetical protein
MTKWRKGDYCVAFWNGEYRPFQIMTITHNNKYAHLHATTKKPDERVTVRTIRRLELLKPLPQDQQQPKKMMILVDALTLIVPCAALAGMIYLVLKPERLKDDR